MDVEQVFLPDPEGADRPIAGFYAVDRRGAVGLPVRIWFGPAIDPDDGAYMLERGERWQMMVGDRLVDTGDDEFDRVWPQCLKMPLDQGEYSYRLARIRHAKAHGAKADPWAGRYGKIDLLTAPIPE